MVSFNEAPIMFLNINFMNKQIMKIESEGLSSICSGLEQQVGSKLGEKRVEGITSGKRGAKIGENGSRAGKKPGFYGVNSGKTQVGVKKIEENRVGKNLGGGIKI